MDTVTTTPTPNSTAAAAQVAAANAAQAETRTETTETAANALTGDFETFLQLLTTQMQNQDPQDPLDSTQFVSQLASFSAVEQQIATNTKLDALIGAMNANAAGQMASWVGTEVQSTAATAFSGDPIDVYYALPEGSANGQILVKSQGGAQIAALPVEAGSTRITWDGKGSDGLTAADGTYTFEFEGFDRSQSIGKGPAETFSPVSEVRLVDDALTLVFDDGTRLAADAVKAVR